MHLDYHKTFVLGPGFFDISIVGSVGADSVCKAGYRRQCGLTDLGMAGCGFRLVFH